ncbi:hypothetical protein KR026_006206, partial [Drosophila bipectinata]
GHSWRPLLGCVIIDQSGFVDHGTLFKRDEICAFYMDTGAIVHTHVSRAIIQNYYSFINVSDG